MPVIPPEHRLVVFLSVLVVASGLALGHWFPWRRLFGRRPHPVFNYLWGVAWVITPLTFLLIALQLALAARLVWLFFAGGGLSVGLCYLVDDYLDARLGRREKTEEALLLSDLLTKRRHDQDDRPV